MNKELRKELDSIKPIAAANYKTINRLVEKIKRKIDTQVGKGKDYVCFDINSIQQDINALEQINKDMVVNLMILEKTCSVSDIYTQEEKEKLYKMLCAKITI